MKPKLLDLFCGAGGCSMGYHRAGFEIVGIDNKPQPNYPFSFFQDDAIDFLLKNGSDFDVIHASPPCQKYSVAGKACEARDNTEYWDSIPPVKEALDIIGKPYVIENVPFAPIRPDVELYGYMFNLLVIRRRWFELGNGIWLLSPLKPYETRTVSSGEFVTVAGNGSQKTRKRRGKKMVYENDIKHWKGSVVETWKFAMGIDWMQTTKELAQSIPPAYTKWIGENIKPQLKLV